MGHRAAVAAVAVVCIRNFSKCSRTFRKLNSGRVEAMCVRNLQAAREILVFFQTVVIDEAPLRVILMMSQVPKTEPVKVVDNRVN